MTMTTATAEIGDRVRRTDAIQLPRQHACDGRGCSHAEPDASQRELRAFFHDRPKHILPLRAEREADANLPRTLRHEKGQNPVDADHAQRRAPGRRTRQRASSRTPATRRRQTTVARMVCTSLTGISWLRLAMVWRSVASTCETCPRSWRRRWSSLPVSDHLRAWPLGYTARTRCRR